MRDNQSGTTCTIGHAGSGSPWGGKPSIVSTPLPRGMLPAESHMTHGQEGRAVAIGGQISYPWNGPDRGRSSVGRALASQAGCRGFESLRPLLFENAGIHATDHSS